MMDFNERVIPNVTANFQFQEALARYKFAKRYIKKEYVVLDIGCGTGYGVAELAKKAKKVIGIDKNAEAINFAKKYFQNYNSEFLIYDAIKLPYPSGAFDMAVSFEVIEHLSEPAKFLSEIKRVVKKRGLIVLSTPNVIIHSPKGIKSPYHTKEYSLVEIRNILKKRFRKVEIYGQYKSKTANVAINNFMASQMARQKFVDKDLIGLRKLFPRFFKEKAWSILGKLFGRGMQDKLEIKDFPILPLTKGNCEYFVSVCEV